MSDDQRQCRRGGISTADVEQELGAALALADMAGVVEAPRAPAAGAGAEPERHQMTATDEEEDEEEEEMASTRLSLQLGRVGIQSPSSVQQQPPPAHHGPSSRPRHALTEAEKEAKRLRRVLANRESARQTIIRRQAIRDELARKVADLSSQNESMKKEKDLVMKEYLSLKETNEQLKVKAQAHHHHLSLSLF
ncbi:hypothetical protein U9M48_034924 [Paspalum notatum var. saurae]|uniref:BZIP domain-containing protein n=1 Tax=Paspalum notatum var. saurae TaxID=547442 RepID=A0AAQ3UED5_PASNO